MASATSSAISSGVFPSTLSWATTSLISSATSCTSFFSTGVCSATCSTFSSPKSIFFNESMTTSFPFSNKLLIFSGISSSPLCIIVIIIVVFSSDTFFSIFIVPL